MKKTFKKIVADTLKSPNGKWSRKNIMMFIAFNTAIMQTWVVIWKHPQYCVEIIFGLLGLGFGMSALALYDKIKNRENKTNTEENDYSTTE